MLNYEEFWFGGKTENYKLILAAFWARQLHLNMALH